MERSPVRVVLDAKLRTPLATSVLATVRETPTWVIAGRKASPIAQDILEQRGCKVLRVDDEDGRLDLGGVLKLLAGEGITRLMVEGGPTVAASFVAADLVDEAALINSDKIIGEGGIGPLEGMALDALTSHLHARGSEALGPDTLERYERA
jgi:diaminohydroxyphosphoribosylaminopyrimidine deaminase / 5-amino-6-(5-phosphoribosylamino)uracil reductase